jgi:hypothetical protein
VHELLWQISEIGQKKQIKTNWPMPAENKEAIALCQNNRRWYGKKS